MTPEAFVSLLAVMYRSKERDPFIRSLPISGVDGTLQKRLGNDAFVAKAPAEVVAEQRERLSELEGTRDKLSVAREQLAAL